MLDGEKFVFYHDEELMLMQTKLLAKIFFRFQNEVFMDGVFCASPNLSYQLIVVRV